MGVVELLVCGEILLHLITTGGDAERGELRLVDIVKPRKDLAALPGELRTGSGELFVAQDLPCKRFAWNAIHDEARPDAVCFGHHVPHGRHRHAGFLCQINQAGFGFKRYGGSRTPGVTAATWCAAQDERNRTGPRDDIERPDFLTGTAGKTFQGINAGCTRKMPACNPGQQRRNRMSLAAHVSDLPGGSAFRNLVEISGQAVSGHAFGCIRLPAKAGFSCRGRQSSWRISLGSSRLFLASFSVLNRANDTGSRLTGKSRNAMSSKGAGRSVRPGVNEAPPFPDESAAG